MAFVQQPPELDNQYDADHVPRYYSFTDDSTIPIFNKGIWWDPALEVWQGQTHVKVWDTDYLSYADTTDPNDPYLYDANGDPKAAVHALTATGGWMSFAMLRQMMEDAESARSSGPLEIDAFLYTNNSIFGIIPRATRADGLDGELILSGGIVAADIGLLSPTRIQIRYDPRGKALIDIPSDTQLTIRRELWAPLALP